MLKILQARLQQYVNHEVSDVQAGFRKGRGTRNQIASIHWIIEKAREFQENINWKILKDMGIPEHLTCHMRNLFAVKKQHLELDMLPNWERSTSRLHISPCLFNLYVEYIMRNTGLDEAQAGIKTARRNINNIRYTDNTTLMAESEEELKSLLMKLKEESEIQHSKIKIMALHGK